MNSRQKILGAIATSKPVLSPYPVLQVLPVNDRITQKNDFIRNLEAVGGTVVEIDGFDPLIKDFEQSMELGLRVVNRIPDLNLKGQSVDAGDDAASLAMIDKALIRSGLGVAENGAVWLKESDMGNRLLPFICQHLVVLLEANQIVANMHEAYQSIDGTQSGYHIFLAGPSKTADIEQSLVIGAHGARSLVVYLISGRQHHEKQRKISDR